MKGYIYKIINKENSKFYVGSTLNLDKRKRRHLNDLRNNRHHCLFLQRAYNKYGETSFEIKSKEVDIIDEAKLRLLEERYIRYCWSSGMLYNVSKKGSGGDLISYHPNNNEFRKLQSKLTSERYSKMSEEDKQVYSEKMMGKGNPNYGHKWSKELRELASKQKKEYYLTHNPYQKGKTFEELFGEEKAKELKMKMSNQRKKNIGEKNGFYGKHHSADAKEKMRKARFGKKPANSKKVLYENNIYDSANECAKKLGIPMVTVAYRCRKEIYGFKYID